MLRKTIVLGASVSAIFYYGQDYAVSQIKPQLLNNASAVVRQQNIDITIKSINHMEIVRKTAITVMNKSADDFARVQLSYNPTTKLRNVKVAVYDKNGRLIRNFGKSDFKDHSESGDASLYADDRVLSLQYTPIDYPYTLVIESVTQTGNTIFIPDAMPLRQFNVSVENYSYTIRNNSPINLRKKEYPSAFAHWDFSNANGVQSYRFTNIQALDAERNTPPAEEVLPYVAFALDEFALEGKTGKMDNWSEFGKWYHNNLLQPVSGVTSEIKEEVDALRLTGTTEEKVQRLFEYMQNKTRYVLVNIGIGGWQPAPVKNVQQKGYGDCKALSNYMKTLLDAAGIKSYYTIINSGNYRKNFDIGFPKMGGNHVILMVPTENGNLWLENTSQKIAFNHLSASTTGRSALAVMEDGIKIVETPSYSAAQSKVSVKTKAEIKPDGSLTGEMISTAGGAQYDNFMVLEFLKSSSANDMLKEYFSGPNYTSAKMTAFTNNRNTADISFNFDFNAANFTRSIGNELLFRAVPFDELGSRVIYEERKLPVDLPTAFSTDYEIHYRLPAGYSMAEGLSPVNLTSQFGEYYLTVQSKQDSIVVTRKLTVNSGRYPADKYKDYLAFRDQVINFDNSKIILQKQ